MNKYTSRRHGSLGFGLLLIAISAASSAQSPSNAVLECNQIPLPGPQPLWISSATFVEAPGSPGKVAVVDSLRSDILLIGPKGDSEVFKKKSIDSEEKMAPAILNRTEDGFVLSTVDQRLYWLDNRLHPTRPSTSMMKSGTEAPRTVVSTYQSIVSGRDFFSFGAVKDSPGKFRFGFFRAPLKAPYDFEFLRDFPEVDYYLLGHKYLAGLKGDEYGVLMNDKAVIVQFTADGNERVLDVIPEKYRVIPKLQTDTSIPNSEAAMFKEIEGLTIPMGLYGRNGLLYLLTREPKAGGGTLWQLFPINPDRPEVFDPIKLPTSMNHLTIVDSPLDWYIFEKGAVQPTGKQPIASMLVIPHSMIQNHSVPRKCRSHLK